MRSLTQPHTALSETLKAFHDAGSLRVGPWTTWSPGFVHKQSRWVKGSGHHIPLATSHDPEGDRDGNVAPPFTSGLLQILGTLFLLLLDLGSETVKKPRHHLPSLFPSVWSGATVSLLGATNQVRVTAEYGSCHLGSSWNRHPPKNLLTASPFSHTAQPQSFTCGFLSLSSRDGSVSL